MDWFYQEWTKKGSLKEDIDKFMFRIKDVLLIKVIHKDDDSGQHQAVVPKEVIHIILQHLHINMENPGRNRTTTLVMTGFIGPGWGDLYM